MDAVPKSTGGIRGAGDSLPLVDLLQVWSLNRFSGRISVSSGELEGCFYFALGEIVHAEAGGKEGEPAFRVILSWTDTTFEPFPNTATARHTIQKRVDHLLLDAHRELDEARRIPTIGAGGAATPAGGGARATRWADLPEPAVTSEPHAPQAVPPSVPSVLDQIRVLHGVTGLVRFGADGRPAGAGAADPEAETIAAKGLYLALIHAGAVAQAFGLAELRVAALESPLESFIVVHRNNQYLCIAVAPGIPVDPLVSQVFVLLSDPRRGSHGA